MKLLHLLRDTKEFADDLRHSQWQNVAKWNAQDQDGHQRVLHVKEIRFLVTRLLGASSVMKLWIFNYFTVVKYLTLVSGSLLKGGF